MKKLRPFSNFDIRKRMRLDHNASVVVCGEGFGRREGSLRDISQVGAYIYLDQGEPLVVSDGRVQVHIILSAATSKLSVEAEAQIVRRDEEGMAIRFQESLIWWTVFSMFPLEVELVEDEGTQPHEQSMTAFETASTVLISC